MEGLTRQGINSVPEEVITNAFNQAAVVYKWNKEERSKNWGYYKDGYIEHYQK